MIVCLQALLLNVFASMVAREFFFFDVFFDGVNILSQGFLLSLNDGVQHHHRLRLFSPSGEVGGEFFITLSLQE